MQETTIKWGLPGNKTPLRPLNRVYISLGSLAVEAFALNTIKKQDAAKGEIYKNTTQKSKKEVHIFKSPITMWNIVVAVMFKR